jgi:hypothetical protein
MAQFAVEVHPLVVAEAESAGENSWASARRLRWRRDATRSEARERLGSLLEQTVALLVSLGEIVGGR